ncbi:UNVERIFIED_CONTAM: hypothetical protein FKN15_054344 [Acipenser sinensis]
MATAVARLPQRVIWSTSSLTLGHRNVRAFMSHCSLDGVYEAIYQGVPFYGDQYDIVTWVQGKGTGVQLDWKTLTEEGLYEALRTVIPQPQT